MMLPRAGLAMVTSWSWTVNARTSFFLHGSRFGSGMDKRYVPLDSAACCSLPSSEVLPTCALGSSADVTEFVVNGAFWGFWVLQGVLCILGVRGLLVYPFMFTGSWLRRCAYRKTRPLGGGRWGHYLRGLLGGHWFPLKCARDFGDGGDGVVCRNGSEVVISVCCCRQGGSAPLFSQCSRHFMYNTAVFPRNRSMEKERPKTDVNFFQLGPLLMKNVSAMKCVIKQQIVCTCHTDTANTDSRHVPCNTPTFDSNPECL